MANTVAYRKFKRQVLQNAQFECEICGTSDGLTVHHMLKQSTFPQYRLDPVNGVCLCGKCHSEIERRLREKEDISKYLGISKANSYQLMDSKGFPILRIGKRKLVPKDKFLIWINNNLNFN